MYNFNYLLLIILLNKQVISDTQQDNRSNAVEPRKSIETKSRNATFYAEGNKSGDDELFVCPKNTRIPIFSLRCKRNSECNFLGKRYLCCKSRCIQGLARPKLETKHRPVLFGWIDRVCPQEPLTEFFDVQECYTDSECVPRICCPDNTVKGRGKSYCRTPAAKFDRLPIVKPIVQPLENVMSYLQCTLPPPPVLDLFPKACHTALDCFPNLCCQEGSQRYCRPPKRSLLTLMVSFVTRLGSSTAAKRFIDRITV